MKPRHQIKFKHRRPVSERVAKRNDKKSFLRHDNKLSNELVKATVQIGERQLHFARALSDSDKSVRDASLSSLREWLADNGSALDATQLDHLWKALFYCIWMADKPRVITSVIHNIVNLSDIAGWPFLNALFVCLMREWFGIDRHRVNKYYELITAALNKCRSMVLPAKDFAGLVDDTKTLMTLLHLRVWTRAQNGGIGLALHVLDVYTDSIVAPILTAAKGLQLSPKQADSLFDMLFADVLQLLSPRGAYMPALHRRIHERVLPELVPLVRDEKLELDVVVQRKAIDRVAKRLFDVAANKRTNQDDRKSLYDLNLAMRTFIVECDEKISLRNANQTLENEQQGVVQSNEKCDKSGPQSDPCTSEAIHGTEKK